LRFPYFLHAADGCQVVLEISGVVGFDLTLLEKGIQIPARGNAQERAELVSREPPPVTA